MSLMMRPHPAFTVAKDVEEKFSFTILNHIAESTSRISAPSAIAR